VFDIARQMSDANKVLSAMCQHYRVSKTLLIEETGSKYVALSSEVPTKHGLNASGIIFDELHAQPNRDLWDVLSTSVGSRKQPMTVAITTAGHDRNSICREQYEYAIKVRDGIINDSSFLTVIYEAADDDDWTSPEVWAKANPNLGISIKLEYLEQKCKEAQESPAKENTFKRLHLNIWTEQDVRWLSMARWDACIGDTNIDDLAGEKCFAGLDMASTTDIAALVLYFPHTDSLLPFFWIPRENAHARERRDRVPYLQWAQSEHIRMTDGNVIDYDVIRKDIVELGERYNICDIAIDRWNSTQLQNQLDGDGFNVVQFGQGYASMSAPTKELERLILQGALQHSGNPVLRWMASNVSVEIDAADNMKPSKKKSTEKIDGVVAAIMAIGRAMTATDSTSVYAEHGIQVIRA
jgi:phage terminase large subunit-like protein